MIIIYAMCSGKESGVIGAINMRIMYVINNRYLLARAEDEPVVAQW